MSLVSCSDPRLIPEEFFKFSKFGSQSLFFFPPLPFDFPRSSSPFSSFPLPDSRTQHTSPKDKKDRAEQTLGKLDATVTRNAGGRAIDAIRSLIVLDNLVPIGAVIVVHHTGSFFPPNFFLWVLHFEAHEND